VNTALIILSMSFAALLGSIGQIAMKRASGAQGLTQFLPYAIAFVALYGISVIINFVVYRAGAKVSIAYPVIALSYVFTALLAWKLLGEPMNGWILLGTACILAGVACIGIGAP
jgi:drug/metabolite transporter (DMT)-like permease